MLLSGLFLRRIIIFFDKLTFSQVVAVYRSYKAYYHRAKVAGTDLGSASETYAAVTISAVDSALSEDMEISSAIGADSDYKLPSPVFGIVGKTDIVPL